MKKFIIVIVLVLSASLVFSQESEPKIKNINQLSDLLTEYTIAEYSESGARKSSSVLNYLSDRAKQYMDTIGYPWVGKFIRIRDPEDDVNIGIILEDNGKYLHIMMNKNINSMRTYKIIGIKNGLIKIQRVKE